MLTLCFPSCDPFQDPTFNQSNNEYCRTVVSILQTLKEKNLYLNKFCVKKKKEKNKQKKLKACK